MTVLILHGIDGRAGDHWEGWLRGQLAAKGYSVIMPQLPASNHPERTQWLLAIQAALRGVDLEDLVIVGHSLGVASALDFIEQASQPTKALISISGFAEDYGAELNGYFMREKQIDFAKVRANLGTSIVFYGDNDPYVPQTALQHLADELRVTPHIVPNGGHLNTDAGYTSFPVLLDAIVAIK